MLSVVVLSFETVSLPALMGSIKCHLCTCMKDLGFVCLVETENGTGVLGLMETQQWAGAWHSLHLAAAISLCGTTCQKQQASFQKTRQPAPESRSHAAMPLTPRPTCDPTPGNPSSPKSLPLRSFHYRAVLCQEQGVKLKAGTLQVPETS